MIEEGRRISVRGTVQGVGFRPWVYRLAREQGIAGRIHNGAEGVTIEVFGSSAALDGFVGCLRSSPPPAARIRDLEWTPIPLERTRGFVIVESRSEGERRVSIPADLATCADCLAEVFDPGNRRYRYPFTNCTNCGPRFTIARGVPYDRPATTMAPFRMCPDCQREYDSPLDRRFHAQPNACPACGPRLRALDAGGFTLYGLDPIRAAADVLRGGGIVAAKGIGGFHLACDATSEAAVAMLRMRKRRDEKPFAVMVRHLESAEEVAWLTNGDRELLASIERPIVLVPRRDGSPLAAGLAPHNPLVGLLLPYSPLHHLLLAEAGRPLVMTSGNLAEEPIAYRDSDALERLGGIADLFLLHDREIESRSDDSVARVVAGRPVVFRRSRGYVPRGIPVRTPFERPVLACGGHLKNTFCIGVGDTAYLGPHIGDLDGLETVTAFEEAVERAEKFLRVRPEIIAHDLHPLYASTRYAQDRAEPVKIAVQHHHAHVASGMAEHGLEGPVLGVAFDGTGYGTDGTAWGGEILLAHAGRFDRVGTLRPIPLPGAERAIHEVWRIAAVLLQDAFHGEPPLNSFSVFREIPSDRLELVCRMAARGIQSPLARGVGRYFDALGSLFLSRPVSRYEGQVALEWNLAADSTEHRVYPFEISVENGLRTLDFRPLVRAAAADFLAGVPASEISGRFHNALAGATAALVRAAAEEVGRVPVVLTGGCFQNALLTERMLDALGNEFSVYRHGEVPPGDGGLALGQAMVAAAVARETEGGL
ncbi:MAG: carbamoyltransferase HypF [Thermoanaerobaculia bacterium]